VTFALQNVEPLLQLPGIEEAAQFPSTYEGAAENFLALIRGVQPSGPYYLLGWSFGGLVAHIISCRLQEQGQSVKLLAILDSYPSSAEHPEIRRPHIANTESDDELAKINSERFHSWSEHFSSASFQPKRFEGDLLLFTIPERVDLCQSWAPYVSGRIIPHVIPANHSQLTRPGPIDQIGKVLKEYLVSRQSETWNATFEGVSHP